MDILKLMFKLGQDYMKFRQKIKDFEKDNNDAMKYHYISRRQYIEELLEWMDGEITILEKEE